MERISRWSSSLHVLDEVERVVGVELLDRRGDDRVGQRLHQCVAHRLVEFGQRFDVEAAAQRSDEAHAVILLQRFDHVGEVGGMEIAHQRTDGLGLAAVQGLHDAFDEGRGRSRPIRHACG